MIPVDKERIGVRIQCRARIKLSEVTPLRLRISLQESSSSSPTKMICSPQDEDARNRLVGVALVHRGELIFFSMTKKMHDLVRRLKDSERTVVLCGAEISTSSGVADFKMLYREDKNLFAALDRTRHHKHPRSLARFLLRFAEKRAPTKAHRFLTRLERSGKLLRCYTMNIDGMERFSDANKVRFVHGRIDDPARCGRRRVDPAILINLAATNGLAEYSSKHECRLRPGFVMYGDAARHIEEMQKDLQRADFVSS